MDGLWALIPGFLVGVALSVYPGSAYARLRTDRHPSRLRAAARAAWPLLALDLGGVALSWLVVSWLWSPRDEFLRALLMVPLLVYLLWRGWFLVETPAARLYLRPDRSEPGPGWRGLLVRPLVRPHRLVLRLAVSYPAALVLAPLGWTGAAALLLGWAAGYVLAHAHLAGRQRRRRPGEPYDVRPDLGRVALGAAGLAFFTCAFLIVLTAGVRALGQ